MRHLGQVIILQVNGDWRRKLQGLKGVYQLSHAAVQQVSGYVAQRPLYKKSDAHPGYREYGPERVDGGFVLFYTNHHDFPTVWLVKSAPGDAPEPSIVTHKTLLQFYTDGCSHYQYGRSGFTPKSNESALVYGLLPADLRVVYRNAPMPDNLLRVVYKRQ